MQGVRLSEENTKERWLEFHASAEALHDSVDRLADAGREGGVRLKVAEFCMIAVVAVGCSPVGAVSSPTPRPSPMPPSADSGSNPADNPSSLREPDADALRVVEIAFESIGTPYRWGGTSANGFDCSGLIRYAYGQLGIELPRISRDQLRMGDPVELRVGALLPGDILGFSAVASGPPTHVGLYVGDGEFIHSSTSGVRVSDLREPYWQQHFVAARRILH